MTWSRDELERLLEGAQGERVELAFDSDELSEALSDVEDHGLRERALVFAVVATGGLGTGVGIANAMPIADASVPAATSVAPAVTAADARVTDLYVERRLCGGAGLGGGHRDDGCLVRAVAMRRRRRPRTPGLTDVSSGAGYAASAIESDAMVSDVASASGYAAPVAQAEASAAGSLRTDASSGGGYGVVESTGSSGEFLSIPQPDTTDALLAGAALLAIAGATFAARRGSGTARPT